METSWPQLPTWYGFSLVPMPSCGTQVSKMGPRRGAQEDKTGEVEGGLCRGTAVVAWSCGLPRHSCPPPRLEQDCVLFICEPSMPSMEPGNCCLFVE